ncbi:MAG: hypothetical protein IT168_31125 [Bryobacterales bacterium]|nr:hypothetical protein [Bryobacterales bacterium]
MKRFEFPLERVRQYRKLQLDTEHARLEQAQARLNAVDAMIVDLHRQEKQEERESREARSQGGQKAVENALQHTRFQSYLLRMAQMLDQQKAQAAQALERQRLILLEARRKFEILDRFRQSSRAEWQVEFNREQEDLAGELFLAKHARQSRQRSDTAV